MEKIRRSIVAPIQFVRRPVVQKISSAMFTQGMLSLTNFIVGFSIAKYAAKSEYGIYVILFSIIGILGNYQNALVNTPLTVLSPKKNSTEKSLFLSGLGFGQWLFYLPLFILTIIIVIIYSFIHQDITILKYVLVLSIAAFAYLLREFIRTVNYSKMRMHIIVKMDALFVFFIVLGMSILIVFHKITSSSSIIVLGIGYFFAAIFANYYARDVYNIQWKSIKNAFSETWQYSRWALVGVTSDIFKNRAYIYIVYASLGLEKIAEISVARLFLMPIGLFVVSSNKIILAKGAEVLNIKGIGRFKKFLLSISCFLFFIWIIYVFCLWNIYDYLTSFLGDKYRNNQVYLLLWGIFFLVLTLQNSITRALMICKEFKALGNYSVICAIIVIVTCLILTRTLDGYGTIISLIVGEFTMLLFVVSRLLVFFKQNS